MYVRIYNGNGNGCFTRETSNQIEYTKQYWSQSSFGIYTFYPKASHAKDLNAVLDDVYQSQHKMHNYTGAMHKSIYTGILHPHRG